jgi:uncharacterized membrane protein
MNRQLHGLVSLGLFTVAAGLGVIAIARSSSLLAILYLCVIALSGLVALYSFCCKCMCRATRCGHVIFGIITQILPKRMSGRYTAVDKAGVIIPALITILYPQYWLIRDPTFFLLFWALVILSLVEIRTWVCRECTNRYCPFSLFPHVSAQDQKIQGKS